MADDINKTFLAMLAESGMPVTEEDIRAEWEKTVEAEDCKIQNNSTWSPFWRLVTAIVTKPVQWLIRLLVYHALPNVFLKYATGAWLDIFAWGVDLVRKGAETAQGRIRFLRDGDTGQIKIPAGTIVESPRLSGTIYRVITTADVTIEDGQTSALAPVTAEEAGAAWNLGPGYYSILPKPVPGVTSVTNEADWLVTPGADEEKDDELRLRARNQFAAVGQFHHDAGYKALISDFKGIRVDNLFFEKDAPRGPGTANCHIILDTGVPPQEYVDSINTYIRDSGNHGHGDDLLCMPITPMPVDLAYTLYPAESMSDEEIAALEAGVESRVRSAFRENLDYPVTRVLPLSRFSISRLDDELHDALPDLRSIEFNTGDIVAGLALPVLNSLTATTSTEL